MGGRENRDFGVVLEKLADGGMCTHVSPGLLSHQLLESRIYCWN
jgi:hypothetical protein